MIRISHRLCNRLTDGGTVVSFTHRPRSTPQKHHVSASGTHFCYRSINPQGLVRLEGLDELKKFIHLIGSRTRYLSAIYVMPQPLRYRVLNKFSPFLLCSFNLYFRLCVSFCFRSYRTKECHLTQIWQEVLNWIELGTSDYRVEALC
jgi:hypothetical protein